MPVLREIVQAVMTRWAEDQDVLIPHITTFHDADSFDAASLYDATENFPIPESRHSLAAFLASPNGLSLQEHLKITFARATWVHGNTTGTTTRVSAVFSRSSARVEEWTLSDLPDLGDRPPAVPITSLKYTNFFCSDGLRNCSSEAAIQRALEMVLKYVCECLSTDYSVTCSTLHVQAKPDVVVLAPPSKVVLVVECKTPWAFDVGDESLHDLYKRGEPYHKAWKNPPSDDPNDTSKSSNLNLERKVFHAVRQLYGYPRRLKSNANLC
ncbi:Aste57867_2482 [Aphanomyces stellatus]|uniref:Aste57867_2482 protein n=1 Tax=Aphanomyces stellatus TaxID=120398 RepID=A0A485KBD4_9STRA|nr:hypothetical protein As57867_002476 [Aphanomyces stellatus]VFT79681.1 Aste57867_2482 [Aphanomyces stellatus]